MFRLASQSPPAAFMSAFIDFISSFGNFLLSDFSIICSLIFYTFAIQLSFQSKALLFSFCIIKSTILLLRLGLDSLVPMFLLAIELEIASLVSSFQNFLRLSVSLRFERFSQETTVLLPSRFAIGPFPLAFVNILPQKLKALVFVIQR